eukprot:scaffold17503_cov86-Phaeocystis_antarctica.AAC.3
MRHAVPPVKTSTRCRCTRTDPVVQTQTRGGLQRRRWRHRLQRKRWYSSQGAGRSRYSRRRGTLHTRCPPARYVARRPSAAPCELFRVAAAVAGPSRQPPLKTPQMHRHQRALRLAQTHRVQGNLPACRSASPHPPLQTASTEQLARVRRRCPPQQPAPIAQVLSFRGLQASGRHNRPPQESVVRAGLLGGAQKAALGASQSAARRCAPTALRASGARTPPWARARMTAAGSSADR